MSLLSYQLTIKKYVRELGLGIRDFNKLDRKHNTINLIKQLQRLNPVASGPTGWYGTLVISNDNSSWDALVVISVIREDTNQSIILNQTVSINGSTQVSISQANRLNNQATKLQINWGGVQPSLHTIILSDGLTFVNFVGGNDLDTSEPVANYTVQTGFINNGNLELRILLEAP